MQILTKHFKISTSFNTVTFIFIYDVIVRFDLLDFSCNIFDSSQLAFLQIDLNSKCMFGSSYPMFSLPIFLILNIFLDKKK